MGNPTLGYEEDTQISKTEIAKIQLIEAINLFIQGKNICAITLAGAAEAILAGYLASQGLTSAVEDSTEAIEIIRKKANSIGNIYQPMHGKSDKEIYNQWNSSRNNLKHHNKNDSLNLTLNIFDESYWLIKRALFNANKANVDIENKSDFENWVIVNINL